MPGAEEKAPERPEGANEAQMRRRWGQPSRSSWHPRMGTERAYPRWSAVHGALDASTDRRGLAHGTLRVGARRTAKLVALVISTYFGGEDLSAFPSRSTIAVGASLSVRAVEKALRRIESAGFIKVIWSNGGNNRPHLYAAVFPAGSVVGVIRADGRMCVAVTAALGRSTGAIFAPHQRTSFARKR